jgi:hypothetical protein
VTKAGRYLLLVVFILSLQLSVVAQRNLEVNGGWVHSTGDFGLDGLGVGGSLWFSRAISIAFNYDNAWDTSRLGVLELASFGTTSINSHLQNVLIGPRYFLPKTHGHNVIPFLEAQFGISHLSTSLEQASTSSGATSSSDNAFSWMLGGGADYLVNPHWAIRGNLDFLRTHFVQEGQSRIRFQVGAAYTFGRRERTNRKKDVNTAPKP